MINSKKGAVLTVYLVGVVVLVASVVAIFFLISQVDFEGDIDKQACKQSIVLRSSLNFDALKAANAVDLECKTRKICLSVSGEDCPEISSTKDNLVERVKITPCKIERRSGVNLDPLSVEKINRDGFEVAGQGLFIEEEIRIQNRSFEPLGEDGFVRIVDGGIFHVKNVRIITNERIEIVVPNVDTYVLFKNTRHGYSKYIQIVGQRDNHDMKDVTISGKKYELLNDRNSPLKFVLDEEGKWVTQAEEGGELVDVCSQTRIEIMEVFAEQMVRCHDMVGEGKLNFIGEDNLGQENYGLICNRIVFDEELKRLPMQPISYLEFYSYLNNRKLNEGSDFEYLYPGVDGAQGLIRDYQNYASKKSSAIVPQNPSEWKLNLDQRNGYGIIVNIAPEGQWLSALAATGFGAVAVGSVVIGGPVGLSVFGGFASGSASYWYLYNDDYAYSPPSIVPFTFDTLRQLNVYDFEVAP